MEFNVLLFFLLFFCCCLSKMLLKLTTLTAPPVWHRNIRKKHQVHTRKVCDGQRKMPFLWTSFLLFETKIRQQLLGPW